MTEEYTIVQIDEPDDAAWKAVGGGIRDFNNSHAGEHGHRNICFLLRVEDGEIAGGLIGETYWNWLYVNLLFVREELRGRGYGEQSAGACGAGGASIWRDELLPRHLQFPGARVLRETRLPNLRRPAGFSSRAPAVFYAEEIVWDGSAAKAGRGYYSGKRECRGHYHPGDRPGYFVGSF